MLEKPQVCWLKYAEKSEKTLKYAGFATSFKRKNRISQAFLTEKKPIFTLKLELAPLVGTPLWVAHQWGFYSKIPTSHVGIGWDQRRIHPLDIFPSGSINRHFCRKTVR